MDVEFDVIDQSYDHYESYASYDYKCRVIDKSNGRTLIEVEADSQSEVIEKATSAFKEWRRQNLPPAPELEEKTRSFPWGKIALATIGVAGVVFAAVAIGVGSNLKRGE